MTNTQDQTNEIQAEMEKAIGKPPAPVRPAWLLVALFAGAILLGLYFFQFNDRLSSLQSDWGTFGDYFGGIMNPTVSLLTLWLLFRTYRQQQYEFKAARWEMGRQEKQLGNQVSELKAQSEIQQTELANQERARTKQYVENTFFQLLNSWNNYRDHLMKGDRFQSAYAKFKGAWINVCTKVDGGQANQLAYTKMANLKDEAARIDKLFTWHYYGDSWIYTWEPGVENRLKKYPYAEKGFSDFLGPYFRMLYNIVKHVDESSLSDMEKEFYCRLLRAQLTSSELLLLFYNALSEPGQGFKARLEKYAFLKHVPKHDVLKASMWAKEEEQAHSMLWRLEAFEDEEDIIELFED